MKLLAMLEVDEDNYFYCKSDQEKTDAIRKDLTQVDADVSLIKVPEDITLGQVEKMIMGRFEAVMNAKYDETFRELSKGEEEAENDRD